MAWKPTMNKLFFLSLILVLAGCSSSDNNEQTLLPGEETILAKVEGQSISRYDLDSAIRSMLGAQQADLLDKNARKKVLESMVLSRVMALKSEQDMSAEEKRELDKKVARYREQLLAKAYLVAHAEPQPVTNKMVTDYYNKHPELFGQKTIYHYEILSGKIKAGGENRKALLASLQQARSTSDWKSLSTGWKGEGKQVDYRQAKGTLDVLEPKLAAVLRNMEQQQTSDIIFQDGDPVVVRMNQKQVLPARPLSQVSAEVRKSLVPIQLKKQIEKISNELMKTTKVEYLN
jgi:EpsD family peptidyl-prolyl cis-trans isomerase